MAASGNQHGLYCPYTKFLIVFGAKPYSRAQGAGYVDPRLDCSRADRRLHRQQIVHGKGQGFFLNIVLGVVGALVGGWLFRFFGETGLTGFSLYSMFVAIIGAVIVLLTDHAIRRVAE